MNILFNDLVVHAFFIGATIGVSLIVYRGYFSDKFNYHFTKWFMTFVVVYAGSFLLHHFLSIHAADVHSEKGSLYAVLASVHGTVALWAIIHASILFPRAHRAQLCGTNYFKNNPRESIVLVSAWVVSLVSGFFLG
jgi:hypothetical protein